MQNGSNETWPEGDLFTWHGAELIIVISIMVTGIIGNSMVMYIYTFRLPGHTVTLIKRMLAGLDLTSLLIAQPLLIFTIVYSDSDYLTPVCVAASYVALTLGTSANFILVTIAVDRFMRLYMMSKEGIGQKRVKRLFAGFVLFCGLVNISLAWLTGKKVRYYDRYKVKVTHCFFNVEAVATTLFRIYFAWISLFFLFSLTTMLILYIKIIKALWRHARLQDSLTASGGLEVVDFSVKTKTQAAQDAMKNSVIVFIIITVLFFVTNSFYVGTIIVSRFDDSLKIHNSPNFQIALDIGKYAPILNQLTNPIIYSFTSPAFRHEVRLMLSGTIGRKGSSFIASALPSG